MSIVAGSYSRDSEPAVEIKQSTRDTNALCGVLTASQIYSNFNFSIQAKENMHGLKNISEVSLEELVDIGCGTTSLYIGLSN